MQVASSSGSTSGFELSVDSTVQRIVAAAADLAFIVDRDGVVVDVWRGEVFSGLSGWEALVGQPWGDTVAIDSRPKVEQLVHDTLAGQLKRPREINQRVGDTELPLRMRGAWLDEERALMLGHDLRPVAEMQQRLVSAQQAMDAEYRKIRQADTRYRVLFHVSAEGALIVRGDERKVIDANPAASRLLGQSAEAVRGRRLQDLFEESTHDGLSRLLGAVEADGTLEVQLRAVECPEVELSAAASMFRESGSNLVLLRFWPVAGATAAAPRNARMMRVLEAMPEGFVVIDEDRRVLSANTGFCDMVQRAGEAQVMGKSLDRWLGRPGVDLNIILANLRERGVVRGFATVLRGDFGGDQEAVVTAVSVLDGKVPCYGFSIRPVVARAVEAPATTILGQPAEQLRALVGRISLKEIIRESAELIEKLCIEAALDVSGNNRAAAAQLLGLSRQSLYSKMRRYSLAEFEPG